MVSYHEVKDLAYFRMLLRLYEIATLKELIPAFVFRLKNNKHKASLLPI